MTVKDIMKLCEAELVCGSPDREVRGCYVGDLLSWVMGRAREGEVWITIMTNLNIVAVAVMEDVACVLLSEGCELPEETRAKAEGEGVCIIRSPHSTYECAAALGKVL